jgi:hypothetical protein
MEKFPLVDGAIRPRNEDRLGKNLSLFFEDGTKAYWGDLSKQDLEKLKGFKILFVLSEHTSFWNVPHEMILETADASFASNPVRFGLIIKEKVKLKPEYVKKNRMAVIKKGNWIQKSEWHKNFCP